MKLTVQAESLDLQMKDSTNEYIYLNAFPAETEMFGCDSVPIERQLELFNPPFVVNEPSVTYGVGQAVYTSFPTFATYRDGVRGLLGNNFSVVSYEYSLTRSSLPDAEDFYVLLPSLDSIRSGEFTEEHIGAHSLNITIQDYYGARSAFTFTVTVQAEKVEGQNGKLSFKLTEEQLEYAATAYIADLIATYEAANDL